jgi:predicted dehydrogenase
MNRRHFIQQLSLGAGATLMHPWLGITQPIEKKLGVALVGLGYYSTYQLAPALEQAKYCRLAGIVTGTPAKAEEWTKKYNIPQKSVYDYKTFDRIIDNPDIDVVYVVLPNSMHHEFVIRAAQAGKHVICEKPMAVTAQECEEMIAACKKANKQLAIGYRLHFEPFNLEMARLGQQKVFGKVKQIKADFGFTIGDPTQWRLKKSLAGGGPLMDVGIYAIQGCRYITGKEPISVKAAFMPKTDLEKFKEVEETLSWEFTFPDGTVSASLSSYNQNIELLRAEAEKGWFELKPAYGYGPLAGKTSYGEMKLPIVNHQLMQLDGIAKSILDGKPNIVPGEEGLRDVKLMNAIYRSAETGNKIDF